MAAVTARPAEWWAGTLLMAFDPTKDASYEGSRFLGGGGQPAKGVDTGFWGSQYVGVDEARRREAESKKKKKSPTPAPAPVPAPTPPTTTAPASGGGGGDVPGGPGVSAVSPVLSGLLAADSGNLGTDSLTQGVPSYRMNLGQRQPPPSAPVTALQKLRVY